MKKYNFLFFALMLFVACENKKDTNPVPKDLIAKDKMTDLLKDMHLAEASVLRQNLKGDTIMKVYKLYYEQVFAIHHTNTIQFKTSLKYYEAHPEELEKMYNEMIIDLTKQTN